LRIAQIDRNGQCLLLALLQWLQLMVRKGERHEH